MNRSKLSFAAAVLACVALAACSSSSSSSAKKKAASGAPATKTAKAPASAAKPTGTTKAGSNVSSNAGSAAPVGGDTQVTCEASEEGVAICADTYAIFCAEGKAWALDCSAAFTGSTCGQLDDGTIDCVVTE